MNQEEKKVSELETCEPCLEGKHWACLAGTSMKYCGCVERAFNTGAYPHPAPQPSEGNLYCDSGKECRCTCHQTGYPLPKDFKESQPTEDWENEMIALGFTDQFFEATQGYNDKRRKKISSELQKAHSAGQEEGRGEMVMNSAGFIEKQTMDKDVYDIIFSKGQEAMRAAMLKAIEENTAISDVMLKPRIIQIIQALAPQKE